MLQDIELRVPSNWINALNFVIFDIFLISCVYYFTADVMGRLNDSTLRDGQPRRLIIACPPVLGGGLTTTHRSRAILLIFARFLGLALILGTNLTIKGLERTEVYEEMDNVLAKGDISNFTELQFDTATILRSACHGSRPPSTSNIEGNRTVIYYGELRGENFSECVTNRSLMTGPVVEFGTQVLNRTMTTGAPCNSSVEDKNNWRVINHFCPKATISCLFPYSENIFDRESCRGLIEHENETYICFEGSCTPEMNLEYTQVRWVNGLDIRDYKWLDAWYISQSLMKDAFDAVYAAGKERRLVKKSREVQWTLVSPLWLVALAFKVSLVAALAISSVLLKRAGFGAVAHDEQRLAQILQTELEEIDMARRRPEQEEKRSIYLNASQSEDGLIVYADSYPRQAPCSTSPEQLRSMSQRNQQLYDAEAMYF